MLRQRAHPPARHPVIRFHAKANKFGAAAALALTCIGIAAADGITVAPLPDGRLELSVITNGKPLTPWQGPTAENSGIE